MKVMMMTMAGQMPLSVSMLCPFMPLRMRV